MMQLAIMLGVIALLGNAIATDEQKAQARAAVKRREPIAWAIIAAMLGLCVLSWALAP